MDDWNSINTYQAIAIILLISLSTYQFLNNDHSNKKIAETINENQQKANILCEQKKMLAQPIITTDYETWNTICYTKSPYYEIKIQVLT